MILGIPKVIHNIVGRLMQPVHDLYAPMLNALQIGLIPIPVESVVFLNKVPRLMLGITPMKSHCITDRVQDLSSECLFYLSKFLIRNRVKRGECSSNNCCLIVNLI